VIVLVIANWDAFGRSKFCDKRGEPDNAYLDDYYLVLNDLVRTPVMTLMR
jgi:hypothetical protein